MRGWEGARYGILAWYANPLFLLAVLLTMMRYFRAAGTLAGLAAVIALTSFAAPTLAEWFGTSATSFTFRAGFYVWLLGIVLLFAGLFGLLGKRFSGR